MEEKFNDDDSIDLGVALMMIKQNEKKMMSLRVEILHLLDKYSKLDVTTLLKDSRKVEHYIITGETFFRD